MDRAAEVANCGLTECAPDPSDRRGGLAPVRHSIAAPLEAGGAPVTASPDVPAEAR